MKTKIIITILTIAISTAAYSCFKVKQCCRQDFNGITCIQRCDYDYCPYNYPIEIK
jgi:hypothetical protein